ncbi:LOW QUALITY PROTEIN: hypothetical protein HMPREF0005_05989, partial [Achromobacter xylosoxidans C54]
AGGPGAQGAGRTVRAGQGHCAKRAAALPASACAPGIACGPVPAGRHGPRRRLQMV